MLVARFVVRTSILFGAARASAELMEPHFAAQIIQRSWKKMLRRRRIKAVRAKRYKMGLKHTKGQFSRGNDHHFNDDHSTASGGASKGHRAGKWTPKSPTSASRNARDELSPLGGSKRRRVFEIQRQAAWNPFLTPFTRITSLSLQAQGQDQGEKGQERPRVQAQLLQEGQAGLYCGLHKGCRDD